MLCSLSLPSLVSHHSISRRIVYYLRFLLAAADGSSRVDSSSGAAASIDQEELNISSRPHASSIIGFAVASAVFYIIIRPAAITLPAGTHLLPIITL